MVSCSSEHGGISRGHSRDILPFCGISAVESRLPVGTTVSTRNVINRDTNPFFGLARGYSQHNRKRPAYSGPHVVDNLELSEGRVIDRALVRCPWHPVRQISNLAYIIRPI